VLQLDAIIGQLNPVAGGKPQDLIRTEVVNADLAAVDSIDAGGNRAVLSRDDGRGRDAA
jgi:hypothetical protein